MSLNRYHMVGMAHDISNGYTVGCLIEPYHNAQGVLSQVTEALETYGQEVTVIPGSRGIVHIGRGGRLTVLPNTQSLRGRRFDVLVVPEHTEPGVIADTVIEY